MSIVRHAGSRLAFARVVACLTVLALIMLVVAPGMTSAQSGGPAEKNRQALFQLAADEFVADGTTPVPAGAIIDNGTIQLGVNFAGHLNVDGGTASSGTGVTYVGVRYMPTNAEATAPGCLCEGWGVADALSAVSGWASIDDGGMFNVTQLSFDSGVDLNGAGWAKCVVQVGNTFSVTHDYHASASPNLYEAAVTIENISGAATDVRYRRVMDWDVEPTAFDEYVTLHTGGATKVLFSSDDGFATSNPLASPSSILFVGEAVDSGPTDHGALFDFGFGLLPVGDKTTFQIYYGAAATETEALNALAAVKAEVYSLGQPNTTDGPRLGTPNTFIFGFKGVGGTPVGGATVVGYVFLDDDLNGVRGATEQSGVKGVPVRVTTPADVLVAGTHTVSDSGWYELFGVDVGMICVEALIPPGYVPTTPTKVCFDNTGGSFLINFGVERFRAAIGDTVFNDVNLNGAQDPGEPGFADVTLALWSGAGGAPDAIVATTTTDANGNYSFAAPLPGDYFVQVTDTAGILTGLSVTTAGNPLGPITVAHTQVYPDADFGYGLVCAAGRGGIAGRVWLDADGNGAQDAAETGIMGVRVCAEPVGYTAIRCRTTNLQGYFRMCVPKGTYLVTPDRSSAPLAGLTPTLPEFYLPVVVHEGGSFLNAFFGYK